MVEDGAFSHKIDFVTIFEEILNPEGPLNRITGSKVTVILLNRWIFPVGEVSLGRVCAQPAKHASYLNLQKLDGVAPLIADPPPLMLHQ